MLIAILDTETTGLDDDAVAIEVAVMLYDLAHASPVSTFASVIRAGSNPAETLNHIPEGVVRDAPPPRDVWPEVERLVAEGEAVLAHNAEFDRRFVPPTIAARRWVCTMEDLQWPRGAPGDGLVKLALAHGLGVATAHRALADVEMLARLLTRVAELGVDLEAFVRRGLRPKATYQACVSYDDREQAKALGFKWEPATKRWLRRVARDDVAALPFPVREVQP